MDEGFQGFCRENIDVEAGGLLVFFLYSVENMENQSGFSHTARGKQRDVAPVAERRQDIRSLFDAITKIFGAIIAVKEKRVLEHTLNITKFRKMRYAKCVIFAKRGCLVVFFTNMNSAQQFLGKSCIARWFRPFFSIFEKKQTELQTFNTERLFLSYF